MKACLERVEKSIEYFQFGFVQGWWSHSKNDVLFIEIIVVLFLRHNNLQVDAIWLYSSKCVFLYVTMCALYMETYPAFQMSDQEDDVDSDHPNEGKENGLVKNTNAAVVQQAEKEKRERAKLESQKKKDKDKEDR